LGTEGSGGFFRRTLACVTSVAESEFLLPVTKSRNDVNELSLFRLFRPLHGQGEDFCGGGGLLVLLAMTPVATFREFPQRIPGGATMRSAAGYCQAGERNSAVHHPPNGIWMVSPCPASISSFRRVRVADGWDAMNKSCKTIHQASSAGQVCFFETWANNSLVNPTACFSLVFVSWILTVNPARPILSLFLFLFNQLSRSGGRCCGKGSI
jgi:hypothetical protein